jgi:transcriptional regulator with XRE-family HTH domain
MGRLINRIPVVLAQKEVRYKTRYTQKDMADGTGLTGTAISRFMRYKTLDNVAFSSIVKLARWLEVNPLDLFEESETDIDD